MSGLVACETSARRRFDLNAVAVTDAGERVEFSERLLREHEAGGRGSLDVDDAELDHSLA